MNTRNTLSFTNFAAVCSSMLLAGALSAQQTSVGDLLLFGRINASSPNRGPAMLQRALPHAPPCQGKQPGQEDQAAPSIGDVHAQIETTDQLEQDAATIDPVPQNKPLPRPGTLALSMQPADGGLSLTLRRDGNELWVGAILGALDPRTVTFGELPAVLGKSTVLAAGIVSKDSLSQEISVDLSHGGFDWVGFYAQGVAFTLEGAQATGIEKAGFRDQDQDLR